MKTKELKTQDLPKLSNSIKERINEGFWSLVETKNANGEIKLVVRTEKQIFELSNQGVITNIFDLKEFKASITARLNFA